MTRLKRVPGEKPLFWVGSSKEDLLTFPEGVQDEIGTALSVAQFGGKHPAAKPWRGEGPGFSKAWRIIAVTLTGRFTQFDSKVWCTFFTPFKRNPQRAFARRRGMWIWSLDG
jgi:hypothetical protein